MAGFEVAKVFVVEDFEKDAVGVPWGAAADEFAVRGAQRVEDGVVEFLVVGYKVEFVGVDYVEGGSADGFGVVWECFYAASIGKVDLCFLRFKRNPRRKLPA